MSTQAASMLIVDDHELYCEGLVEIISRWPEFNIVGSANNGPAAELLCDEHKPDLVLMDVQMPGQDGITTAANIKHKHPNTVVVMLTVSSEKHHLIESLQSGASGYMPKNVTGQRLRDCMRCALHGEIVISGRDAEIVFSLIRDDSSEGANNPRSAQVISGLSERDLQILQLVAQGCSNEEISEALFISIGMVKKYIASLMQRLQVDNRVKLAVFALKAGLAK